LLQRHETRNAVGAASVHAVELPLAVRGRSAAARGEFCCISPGRQNPRDRLTSALGFDGVLAATRRPG
jgi:hypothetical protein